MLTELVSRLLPDATAVQLDSVEGDANSIVLTITMVSATVDCPQCQQPATKVHSRYVRTLADLPWATLSVQLRLTVRKFFCHNPACARRIFAEQPPNLVVPFARRTNRLRVEQQQLALAHGGEAGARTARRLKMPLSPDTLLRLARRALLPPLAAPQVIGVDEWSYRRGRSYGTIVVDLERHRAIALLPDRSAESFATWLKEHPSITVISRDRAGTYANGARQGAPQATQVADRFHLLVRRVTQSTILVTDEKGGEGHLWVNDLLHSESWRRTRACRKKAEDSRRRLCCRSARPARYGERYTAQSLGSRDAMEHPPITTSQSGVVVIRRSEAGRPNLRDNRRWPTRPFKDPTGPPTSRSIRRGLQERGIA